LALNDPVNARASAEFREKANRLNEFCSEGLLYRVRRGKEESNELQLRVRHDTIKLTFHTAAHISVGSSKLCAYGGRREVDTWGSQVAQAHCARGFAEAYLSHLLHIVGHQPR
jgi:hypothetical protein